MRQDVFAMKPRAIGGDEVQPAGHDICGFDGVLWCRCDGCLVVKWLLRRTLL